MTPEVRAFVNEYARRNPPPITVKEFIKNHNHEIWKDCLDCGEHFDLRKQLHIDRCPKCESKNIK
ncbi:hypothetical protein [Chryseobacterium terrae]|uniref:Zinc-ribbon containing domain-containing protein n=1 Tax=Chryseobacterium terrae TaxID=3163299 RepID=A0ABW8Y4A1_9FLAO